MSGQAMVHTREQFALLARAPLEIVFPLFGADQERVWASEWDPIFVWPAKALDQPGMVFKVRQGDKTAVWVNTAFDHSAGRIQYVYMIPELVLTVITLKLEPDAQSTNVEVIYERTALSEPANEIVKHMAASDRLAGGQWSEQINAYLRQLE